MDYINYKADGTGAGPSRGVWADFKAGEVDRFAHVMDDFLTFTDQVSTEEHAGYVSYMDTGVTCTQVKTAQGGVIMFDSVDDSDSEGAITPVDSNILGSIVTTAGSNKKLWFETRVKFSATTNQSAFIGLAGANCPANGLLADAGTGISGKNLVGFSVLEADPDGIDCVYDTAAGYTTAKDVAQVITADTWYKLGIHYDGTYVKYYVDSVEVASVLATADNFPDGVYLTPLFALKTHEGADKNLSIDWWRFGIER